MLKAQLSSKDVGSYVSAIILLSVLLLSATLFNFSKSGLTPLVYISVIILMIMIFMYKSKMNAVYSDNKEFEDYKSLIDKDPQLYLSRKLNYLRTGIAVKDQRIIMTRLIYKMLFPIFLLNLRIAFQGVGHLIWVAVLAIVISTIVWHFYFSGRLEDLRIDAAEVDGLISKLNS